MVVNSEKMEIVLNYIKNYYNLIEKINIIVSILNLNCDKFYKIDKNDIIDNVNNKIVISNKCYNFNIQTDRRFIIESLIKETYDYRPIVKDIEMSEYNNQTPICVITMVGDVSAGKSTFVKKMTLDSFSSLMKHSKEIKTNSTTNTCFGKFKLDDVTYALTDNPGHHNYITNMISGGMNYDAVIIIISASKPLSEQTQCFEHLNIIRVDETQHILVLLNKIDLVSEGWCNADYVGTDRDFCDIDELIKDKDVNFIEPIKFMGGECDGNDINLIFEDFTINTNNTNDSLYPMWEITGDYNFRFLEPLEIEISRIKPTKSAQKVN